MYSVSVVIPCYNVQAKIDKCLKSIESLKKAIPESEVVFVDDCSTDGTYQTLDRFARGRDWAVLIKLPENSGSPSAPRNRGINGARGRYIFFLDADDEILPEGLTEQINALDHGDADFIRSPLIRFNGKDMVEMNDIPEWNAKASWHEKAETIVRKHSTTPPALYRRSFLKEQNILWPTDLRLAEDAVFLYTALQRGKVDYTDKPIYLYNTELIAGSVSSTQQYQDRELSNQIEAWKRCSAILQDAGIDYFKVRGQVALQAVFQSMIRFNVGGFDPELLNQLIGLLRTHEGVVRSYTYGKRFAELRDLLLDGKVEKFLGAIKQRLLIAGYDLKFILPAIPALSDFYQIRVDEWQGHETHDENKSRRLLQWADTIHCEWMLGNAVWYSHNKLDRQGLSVRLHRFELTRDFGFKMDRDRVSKIMVIAPRIAEEMLQKFKFDRSKVAYVPNYIDVESYARTEDPDKVFNLAMVGSVPKLKGLYRALELLNSLRAIDSRYNLTIYGKRPDELSWVKNDPAEREYFQRCREYIRAEGLENIVSFEGWVDTKTALADKGFVLSLSDLEGSHVAAAESFAAGNITLFRPWAGVEYMYPSQYIMESLDEMRDYILACRNIDIFRTRSKEGGDFVSHYYGIEKFVAQYLDRQPGPISVP